MSELTAVPGLWGHHVGVCRQFSQMLCSGHLFGRWCQGPGPVFGAGPVSWMHFKLPRLPPRLSLVPGLPSHGPFSFHLKTGQAGRQSLLQSLRLIP